MTMGGSEGKYLDLRHRGMTDTDTHTGQLEDLRENVKSLGLRHRVMTDTDFLQTWTVATHRRQLVSQNFELHRQDAQTHRHAHRTYTDIKRKITVDNMLSRVLNS